MEGKFIVFEGLDCSGKTTMAKAAYEYLQTIGVSSIYTREIGGTPLAENIRNTIINNTLDPVVELLLVSAARRDSVENVIKPALDCGKVIICDRFIPSTFAYQVALNKLPSVYFDFTTVMALEGVEPDAYVFLDVDADTSYSRASSKSSDKFERLEKQHVELLHKAYSNFFTNQKLGSPVYQVDALRSIDEVQRLVISCVMQCLENQDANF